MNWPRVARCRWAIFIPRSDAHVSVLGVEDLVVVTFDDRVLVVPKDDSQRVRELVARLRERDAF